MNLKVCTVSLLQMKDLVLLTIQYDYNQHTQFHPPGHKGKSFVLATQRSRPSCPSLCMMYQGWHGLYSEGELVPFPFLEWFKMAGWWGIMPYYLLLCPLQILSHLPRFVVTGGTWVICFVLTHKIVKNS